MHSEYNRIIFLHIPKNAGTTMHSLFERNYRPSEIFSFRCPRERSYEILTHFKSSRLNRLKVIKGHWPYGLHQIWQDNKSRYVTLLRDPVKRILSSYSYVRRSKEVALHNKIHERGLSFAASIEEGVLSDNAQTRWLMDEGLRGKANLDLEAADRLWAKMQEANMWVGSVERFDESVIMLSSELGWKQCGYVERNRKPKNDKYRFTEEDLEVARNATLVDQRLYQLAMEDFDKRWESFSEAPDQDLNRYRSSNQEHRFSIGVSTAFSYLQSRLVWKVRGHW